MIPFRVGVFTTGKPIRPVLLLYTGDTDISQPFWVKEEAEDGRHDDTWIDIAQIRVVSMSMRSIYYSIVSHFRRCYCFAAVH